IHLLFVGSGELERELRKSCQVVYDVERPAARDASAIPAAASSVVQPPVSFAGFLNQTEISRAYVAADCLVLPSDHGETWGLVVNEALASGLACLVSDACGCAQELTGESGSFQFSNIPGLASKLIRVANDRGELAVPPSIAESVSSICRAYQDLCAVSGVRPQLTA